MTSYKKQIRKQIIEYKNKLLKEAAEREQLLSNKTNWAMLEEFIQRANSNPGLRVDIELRDGTIIHISTLPRYKSDPYIGE